MSLGALSDWRPSGSRIVVTGITSEVAKPVAIDLAKDNEVIGVARFRDPAAREPLEAAGVKTASADLVKARFDELPEQADYVLNFAVVKSGKWGVDLDGNVSGLAYLMERYSSAKAFLHCSSGACYAPNGHTPLAEDSPLGDSHRNYYLPTYSISKIAAEATARHFSRRYNLPTTIARLNVPYGDAGGWPLFQLALAEAGQPVDVHPDAPNQYHVLHTDDIVATVPRLLEIATSPATTVNWAGDEVVSVEEWMAYLEELTGITANLVPSEMALSSVVMDLTRMNELVGHSTVTWRDGFRRMIAAQRPDLLKS